MNRVLENGLLSTALDFDGHSIVNWNASTPPQNVVSGDDSQLSDSRNVPDGSVTNSSVNVSAGIDQSKLTLDGAIPAAWLGASSTQAARGDLVERLTHRGANNGYAPLNSGGTLDVSKLPATGPGVGTVLSVGLSLPRDLDVTINEVTGAGSLTAAWENVPDNSWFGAWGTKSPGWTVGQPFFVTDLIPDTIVPSLNASKFTSGVFDLERLPVGTPFGTGHARGLAPDPSQLSSSSDPSDYLGRDLTWKQMKTDVSYQPTLPDVVIEVISRSGTSVRVTITGFTGSSLFYKPPLSSSYMEVSNPYVFMAVIGQTIKAYSAKDGYNNSEIASYLVTG